MEKIGILARALNEMTSKTAFLLFSPFMRENVTSGEYTVGGSQLFTDILIFLVDFSILMK